MSKLSYDDAKVVVNSILERAANKRPTTMIPRKGRYTANSVPTTKPPYNTSSLDRFEDTFRSDGVAQRGIIKRAYLVMGKHGKIVLDTTDEYDDEDERRAAIDKVSKNTKYQEARKRIQKLHVKPEVNFHNNVMSGLIQSKVYGRAALEIINKGGITKPVSYTAEGIELEPQGVSIDQVALPTALHLCNSKRLGHVEIEVPTTLNPNIPNTWAFKGVHYLDINAEPGGKNDLLKAENIIYMANKDYHISPGSLYYGLSDLESIVDGSEAKRIAKQEDIKEIMKSCWAPYLIVKFTNANITNEQMQEVIDAMQPGLPFGTKQDIETEVKEMNANLGELPKVIDFLNKETIRDLGLPSFIIGYEDIANYANSQQILLALKEIELEAERTWLADVIEKQWLNRYFYQLLGLSAEDEPEVKLKYEFSDVSFETTLDKTNFALNLFRPDKLISGEKVLKIADMEDEIDEYKVRAEEQKKLQEQRFNMEMQNNDREEMLARNQVSTTFQKRQAQQDKDAVYQKIKEKLDTI